MKWDRRMEFMLRNREGRGRLRGEGLVTVIGSCGWSALLDVYVHFLDVDEEGGVFVG